MDHQYPELNLGTRLFIDNREYDIKWSKQTKQDDIIQVGQYILNEILKHYQTDSVIMKDNEQQEYGLKDIISFQVREIFVYVPHKKEIKTFVKTEMREFRQVYYIISSEQVKIERFKEKNTKIDSIITNLQIIRKQNQGFENTLRQLVESRLNNLQINNPPSPILFYVAENHTNDKAGGNNNNNSNDDYDDQQQSPKFGASSENISAKNTFKSPTTTSAQSAFNQPNLLGGQSNDLSFDESDLKKRQKVASLGTQSDYMKKQAQQGPNEIKGYTMQEVSQHKTDTDAWIVINGKIYDVTHYLNYHPGGKPKLMMGVGRDGTELFQKYHPWVNAHYILQKNQIGFVIQK